MKRRRPATSVHGFALAVRRARARARARAIMGLYHVGSVDARVRCEFAMRWTKEDRNHGLRDEPIDYEHEHEHDGILWSRGPEHRIVGILASSSVHSTAFRLWRTT
ncbi:MAG: hypothetical protein KGS49_08490 [Planctomycetes bacterium]|nr:hypothetical protein [Planctomycetota bacterium]